MNLLLLPDSKNWLIIKTAHCNSNLHIFDYRQRNYPFIILATCARQIQVNYPLSFELFYPHRLSWILSSYWNRFNSTECMQVSNKCCRVNKLPLLQQTPTTIRTMHWRTLKHLIVYWINDVCYRLNVTYVPVHKTANREFFPSYKNIYWLSQQEAIR